MIKNVPEIVVCHYYKENGGAGAAWNDGVAAASGDCIGFVKAESIVQINQSFYHYVRRGDSLAGFWTSLELLIDYSFAPQNRYRDLWDGYGNIHKWNGL